MPIHNYTRTIINRNINKSSEKSGIATFYMENLKMTIVEMSVFAYFSAIRII